MDGQHYNGQHDEAGNDDEMMMMIVLFLMLFSRVLICDSKVSRCRTLSFAAYFYFVKCFFTIGKCKRLYLLIYTLLTSPLIRYVLTLPASASYAYFALQKDIILNIKRGHERGYN